MPHGTLVVVIGAGASHGCRLQGLTWVDESFGPPLVGQLFDGQYRALMNAYPGVTNLAPIISGKTNKRGATLERVLAELSAEPAFRTDYRQVPLYLRDLFQHVSSSYVRGRTATAFHRLAMNVKQSLEERFAGALFVSLNYDTLLESAFRDVFNLTFHSLSDYIAPPRRINLLKPHGCIRWVREAAQAIEGNVLKSLASIPEDTDLEDRPIEVFQHPESSIIGDRFMYPAMVIPAAGKIGFIYPNHVERALPLLAQCRALLVLGTRLLDDHVLQLLGNASGAECVNIVSRSEGEEVQRRLFQGPFANRRSLMKAPACSIFADFAEYVQGDYLEAFLGLSR